MTYLFKQCSSFGGEGSLTVLGGGDVFPKPVCGSWCLALHSRTQSGQTPN